MSKSRRNRVTPEGHAKHVEVALKNFHGMKVGQAAKASIRAEVDEFKRELLASVDVAAHPGKRLLVYSCAASLAALRVIVQRLSAANLTRDEFRVVTEALQPLQSESRRTLALLGVTTTDSDERSAADQAALDSLLDYTKKDGTNGETETESNRNTAEPE